MRPTYWCGWCGESGHASHTVDGIDARYGRVWCPESERMSLATSDRAAALTWSTMAHRPQLRKRTA